MAGFKSAVVKACNKCKVSECCEFSKNRSRSGNGVLNVGAAVGGTYKAGFVEGWGNINTVRQQSVKQMVEAAAIGGHDLRVIAGQLRQQKETKHAALAVSAEGQPVCLGRRLEALHQLACLARQRLKNPGWLI